MNGESYPLHFDHMTTATVRCEAGDFKADAHDAAEVQSVLADAAMHVAALGPRTGFTSTSPETAQ
jgi:hypothetical protein